MSQRRNPVIGFSFEPKRPEGGTVSCSIATDETRHESAEKRNELPAWVWCQCKKCSLMCKDFFLKEEECFCCQELSRDVLEYFNLEGILLY